MAIDPISAIFAGVNFLIQVGGAIYNTAAAAEENRQRRELGELEARRYELEAQRVLEETGLMVEDYQREGRQVFGAQVLAYARSGVRLAGSPLVRLQQTQERMAEGTSRILARGENQADDLRRQAETIRMRAEVGLDPTAVAISHLPGIASTGLALAQELELFSGSPTTTTRRAAPGFWGSTPSANRARLTEMPDFIGIE